jgi:hypothetical protein
MTEINKIIFQNSVLTTNKTYINSINLITWISQIYVYENSPCYSEGKKNSVSPIGNLAAAILGYHFSIKG